MSADIIGRQNLDYLQLTSIKLDILCDILVTAVLHLRESPLNLGFQRRVLTLGVDSRDKLRSL